MILSLVLVAVAMACQDLLATGMTVAEARNMALWAGSLDAANDVASRVGTVVTAAIVTKNGWSTEAFAALAVTATTSFFSTQYATRLAHRLLDHRQVDPVAALEARVAVLEQGDPAVVIPGPIHPALRERLAGERQPVIDRSRLIPYVDDNDPDAW